MSCRVLSAGRMCAGSAGMHMLFLQRGRVQGYTVRLTLIDDDRAIWRLITAKDTLPDREIPESACPPTTRLTT